MLIKLFRCDGCWRVTDNYQTSDGTWTRCKCGSKHIWSTRPIKWNIFKWWITNPKYVLQLYIQDIREKYRGQN